MWAICPTATILRVFILVPGHQVVWCGVVWCGVVWCGVVWCGVVWCGVVWCGVVWCGVVWCGVVWCGVVWCGVPKVLLTEGNGRDVYPRVQVNGRAVCLARAPCVSVWLSAERGVAGKPGCNTLGVCCHLRSSRCTPSLSLSACWCRRSSCNTHAIVLLGPKRAFSNVARTLAWAYHTLMDSSMTLRMNSVLVGPRALHVGPLHGGGSQGCRPLLHYSRLPQLVAPPIQPVFPPFDLATLLAGGGPAPTHGTGPSRSTGGAPFWAALHRGGTWCLAPCSGGRTGVPRQSSWGCCPCGVL